MRCGLEGFDGAPQCLQETLPLPLNLALWAADAQAHALGSRQQDGQSCSPQELVARMAGYCQKYAFDVK